MGHEMATPRKLRPLPYVGIAAFGPLARHAIDRLGRERDGRRDVDPVVLAYGWRKPRPIIIESDGGAKGFGRPINCQTRKQFVRSEPFPDVSPTIAPAAEFLYNPSGKRGGGIVHAVSERLRTRTL